MLRIIKRRKKRTNENKEKRKGKTNNETKEEDKGENT